jgi:hypothetical protein
MQRQCGKGAVANLIKKYVLEVLTDPPKIDDDVQWILRHENERDIFISGIVLAVYPSKGPVVVTVDCYSVLGRTSHRWWELFRVNEKK